MRKTFALLALTTGLGACGYVDAYEKAVYELEPTYCYQSIGKTVCHREPYHRDERRLVNYFGPHPSRYDKPEAPEPETRQAPAMVNYWVKDAEPTPRPAPTTKVAALPWLDPANVEAEVARADLARRVEDPTATRALLGRMGIGPHGEVDPRHAAGRAPAKAPKAFADQAAAVMAPDRPPAPRVAPQAQQAAPVRTAPFIEIDVN